MFIGGEPGGGKSRLLAEAATALHRHGATMLLGTCVADFGAPYQPYVEPIEALLPGLVHGQLTIPGTAGPDAAGTALKRLVDRLRTLVGRREPGEAGEPEREYRRELYDAAVTGALEQIRPLITGQERPTAYWAPGLLALYTELQLDQATARLLRWLLDQELPRYQDSAQWPGVLAFLVEAALSLRDEAAARRLRPLLAEYAGLNLVAGQFVALFGSADRYLGAVDSLLNRGTPQEWFASALDMDTRMGAPVHQAQTLAAQVLHESRLGATGRRVEELMQQVRSIAEPLGLRRVLHMLPTVRSRSGAASRPDGLTARETEVLRLLADGLINRDIAERLVISENTAANHVRSILTKTGCGNRTQAAMYASAHGLLN